MKSILFICMFLFISQLNVSAVQTDESNLIRRNIMKAKARHILVGSQEECEDLKTRIEGGEDFGKVAAEHSKCPSGQQGGDLGEFSQGQMVPEFDEVVFSAEVGKVHGPVKTNFGYHLIEITSRTE
jgi:peptidyl-prolyl cis-trans isomerase C